MDNLIALIFIHVLLPFLLILLILELMQPVLLTSCLICFYNYEMDSYSSPARELSTGPSESAPGLWCCCFPLCQWCGVTAGPGLTHQVPQLTPRVCTDLGRAGAAQSGLSWAVTFECWVNHSVISVGRVTCPVFYSSLLVEQVASFAQQFVFHCLGWNSGGARFQKLPYPYEFGGYRHLKI